MSLLQPRPQPRLQFRLTDLQLVLLSAAAQREDRLIEPSTRLRGAVAGRCLAPLLRGGLVSRMPTRPGDPLGHRLDGDDPVLLRITVEGLAAIGIEPEANDRAACPVDERSERPEDAIHHNSTDRAEPAASQAAAGTVEGLSGRQPLVGSVRLGLPQQGTSGNGGRLLDLLRKEDGTTLAAITAATGWLPHSARAALSRLRTTGHDLTVLRVKGQETCYLLVPVEAGAAR